MLSKHDGANELVLQAWAMLKLLQAMTVTGTWAMPSGRDHNRDCGRAQWPRPRNKLLTQHSTYYASSTGKQAQLTPLVESSSESRSSLNRDRKRSAGTSSLATRNNGIYACYRARATQIALASGGCNCHDQCGWGVLLRCCIAMFPCC